MDAKILLTYALARLSPKEVDQLVTSSGLEFLVTGQWTHWSEGSLRLLSGGGVPTSVDIAGVRLNQAANDTDLALVAQNVDFIAINQAQQAEIKRLQAQIDGVKGSFSEITRNHADLLAHEKEIIVNHEKLKADNQGLVEKLQAVEEERRKLEAELKQRSLIIGKDEESRLKTQGTPLA